MSKGSNIKSSRKSVFITGASSIIGRPVAHELALENYQIIPISRNTKLTDAVSWDMQTGVGSDLIIEKASDSEGFYLIHCAPIWFLPQQMEWLISIGLRRVIVFSSSSIDGKNDSNSKHEQQIVKLLRTSENDVIAACRAADIDLTIFRPTMIYGYGQGQNLAFIAKIIQRFKCFPVASPAMGLRQPVHANDLAKAVVQAIDNSNTYDKKYTLSGAEALPYKEIVKRIFIALGYAPRVIAMNGTIYRFALNILNYAARLFGKSLPVDPAMVDRMQQDLSFDHSLATNDFDYAPSAFLPNGVDDLIQEPVNRSHSA